MGLIIFILMVIAIIAVARYFHWKEANKKWDVAYDDELEAWKRDTQDDYY